MCNEISIRHLHMKCKIYCITHSGNMRVKCPLYPEYSPKDAHIHYDILKYHAAISSIKMWTLLMRKKLVLMRNSFNVHSCY